MAIINDPMAIFIEKKKMSNGAATNNKISNALFTKMILIQITFYVTANLDSDSR